MSQLPEHARHVLPPNGEVSEEGAEADILEQRLAPDGVDDEDDVPPEVPFDVPEADYLEQHMAGGDADDDLRGDR